MAFRRLDTQEAQFLLLTVWESEEAIRRFAGPEPSRARFYPEDDRFLVGRGETVRHFELVHADGQLRP
jgi:heme-degrading monooxygenase HmoA